MRDSIWSYAGSDERNGVAVVLLIPTCLLDRPLQVGIELVFAADKRCAVQCSDDGTGDSHDVGELVQQILKVPLVIVTLIEFVERVDTVSDRDEVKLHLQELRLNGFRVGVCRSEGDETVSSKSLGGTINCTFRKPVR